MKTYMEKLKTTLYGLIHEISAHYWLYVSDPKRNFSRERKLSFEKVLAILVSMGGGTLRSELIDHFLGSPARYRCLPNSSPFGYIDLHDNQYCDLNIRFVRFRISEDAYETVITNLPADEFPVSEIKHLYNLRWGIETSFRELKYTIGLKQPVSKKAEYISQEIFARCLMYNFCELVTSHVAIRYQSEKYVYQTNFSVAVHICRLFLRGSVAPPDAKTNISRNLVPVRPNRKAPRNLNRPRFNGFLYKVA